MSMLELLGTFRLEVTFLSDSAFVTINFEHLAWCIEGGERQDRLNHLSSPQRAT